VLQDSVDWAITLDSMSVDPEHLLMALMQSNNVASSRILLGMRVYSTGASAPPAEAVQSSKGLSERTRRAIEFAIEDANRFGHHNVDTGHLLLGLVRESEESLLNPTGFFGRSRYDEMRPLILWDGDL
jgi:ATP-dependent Clp protease ATP-binding subunit ClpA